MSRHLADHRAPTKGARARNFWKLEREQGEEGTHPASVALSQRPENRESDDTRVREFLRIDRGSRA